MNPKIMIGYNFLIKKSTEIPFLKIPEHLKNITHKDLLEIFNFAKNDISKNINPSEKLLSFGIKNPLDARKIVRDVMEHNNIKGLPNFEKSLNETIKNFKQNSNETIKNLQQNFNAEKKSLLKNPLVTGGVGFGAGLLLSKSLFSNQNSKSD